MRLTLALVLVAAGCGSKPAHGTMTNEAPELKSPSTPIVGFPRVSAPRPDIAVEHLVPDFHEELRWPLSAMSHPELDPQFEIARVFAQPGIGWIELCDRGVQHRITSGRNRDELEYLRGWCAAIKGDADTACEKLVPLTSSPVLGIPAAVRIDVANIIANAGNIDKADALLNKHRIRDIEIWDTLAATYAELGMERDAYAMNRRALDAAMLGDKAAAAHCRRLVKDIVLGDEGGRMLRLGQLSDMATKPKVPDEVCVKLDLEAKCFVGPAYQCKPYFDANNIDPRNEYLLEASRAWPTTGTYKEWLEVVRTASPAGDLSGTKELIDVALDAAIRAAPACATDLLRAIVHYTKQLPNDRLIKHLMDCKWDPQSDDVDHAGGSSNAAATVMPPPQPSPPPRPPVASTGCDPGAKETGVRLMSQGAHAEALAHFESSLRCEDSPYIRKLAFIEACASRNSAKAKHYFKLISPTERTKVAQFCTRQSPPVEYE